MSKQASETQPSGGQVPESGGDDLLVAMAVRKEFGGLLAVNDLDFTIPCARR